MTQSEMQQALIDALSSGKLQPTNIVLGDYVQHKIDNVEAGGIGVQENHYHQGTTPTNEASPQKRHLKDYLIFDFYENHKADYEAVLSIIQEPKWLDKDRARFALAIYDSKVMNKRTKPQTFLQWSKIFCDLFGFQYHPEYKRSRLNQNQAKTDIERFLSVLDK